ncbi:MAG: Holliday junction branch migration protein RuvA [Cetobacterium somerae]|uniref:Holliday junction branch migration complex subunit RuvA n=1 Tax=Cetobacterium somerae ATCC BAA-474 TaxID=1319815 RepID=U7V8R1_9FUSO|nr:MULTISPECIES: Holliday junction branch migration protein RuvA [Cetobacterium]ERT68097.1 Holliday junction DNA helicase RuvA [Cetobacterium somerae ATCC BAA-474]MBC2853035.1 Holliday junction branch migration protein RuvA [Cetobacterium sp. 2G large]MCQ8211597.1 Holliday junction branch migration protein RuvA [Cetobacterium sp. NK01]MCQ9625519.1 Holliday junction branch migration protein RuvA [Cetobacterium somerae]MCX3067559.1 Holliday junction branch migration protein RuvA [Cetobacterium s
MFEYLNGVIKIKKPEYLAVDVNGVGYRVYITLKTYDQVQVGEKKELYIYNVIKEDAFKLVGFLQERERVLFEMLIGISGIGLSLALSIMSTFSIDNIREIVLTEDFKTLKRVPKLGEKKSKQIIIDLNNKIKTLNLMSMEDPSGDMLNNAIEEELYMALDSLGYSKKEIDSMISKDELNSYSTLEEAIKGVLKKIQLRG